MKPWDLRALVWNRRWKSPTELLVMLILAEHADHQMSCFPGQSLIADHSLTSVRTIRTLVKKLEGDGILTREKRWEGGHQTSDRYWLNVDAIAALPEMPSDFKAAGSAASKPEESSASMAATGTTHGGNPTVHGGKPYARPNNTPTEEHQQQNTGADKPPAKRRSQIPTPFSVTDDMQSWVARRHPAIDWKVQTELFCTFHQARGNVMKDWNLAWQNWMHKAAEFSSHRKSNKPVGSDAVAQYAREEGIL